MRGEAGNPQLWRWGRRESFRGGFILSALEVVLKEQLKATVRILRDLDICPSPLGAPMTDVFLQNFMGDITVTTTRHFLYKLLNLLTDPADTETLRWWIREGHLMMWPKMSVMIARMKIERTLGDLLSDLNKNSNGNSNRHVHCKEAAGVDVKVISSSA